MMWFILLVLAAIACADDSKQSSDTAASYGVAQAPVQQVQQIPIYGHPEYNLPIQANVKGGRHHGPFFDGYVNNYSKSDSRESESDESKSDSDESDESNERGAKHNYPGNYYYPFAPAWPFFNQYYQAPLSNPFFVADRNKRSRRNHRGRRHRRPSRYENEYNLHY